MLSAGLELANDKTKIIEFGRYAARDRARRGEGKPETFNFLGFTLYCSQDSRKKFFRVKVASDRKKVTSKLKKFNEWFKAHRDVKIGEIIKKVNQALRGYYQYYGVTDNTRSMQRYRYQVIYLLYKWMNPGFPATHNDDSAKPQ